MMERQRRRRLRVLRADAERRIGNELARLARLQQELTEARLRYERAIAEVERRTEAALAGEPHDTGPIPDLEGLPEMLPRFPASAHDVEEAPVEQY